MLSRMDLGRKSFSMFVAVLTLMLGGMPLEAQEVAGSKVGVFNADRVLSESLPGQQALALFNQLREQRVGELQAQQNQINTLQQQAMQAAPGSPDGARLQREMEDLMLLLERSQQDVQQELGERQNELTAGITQMVGEIIETMGSQEGYTLIFNAIQSGLVYMAPALDITEEIITRINAMSAAAPNPL